MERFTSHSRQNSGEITSYSNGEAVYQILKSFMQLHKSPQNDLDSLMSQFQEKCQRLTGASSSQLFLKEDTKLKLFKERPQFYCDIDSFSLPGFVAEHRIYQIINNVQESKLYASFNEEVNLISKQGTPSNLCAVPLVNEETNEVLGVLIVYNKAESTGRKLLFNLHDYYIIKAAFLVLSNVLGTWNLYKNYRSKTEMFEFLDQQASQLEKVSNISLYREKLLAKCKKLLNTEKVVTKELFELICHSVHVDGGILHLNLETGMTPVMEYGLGIALEDESTLKMVFSKYEYFSGFRNVGDVHKDLTWSEQQSFGMKSLLWYPIQSKAGTSVGAVEFLRKEEKFEKTDEWFASEIVSSLCEIPCENYSGSDTESTAESRIKEATKALLTISEASVSSVGLFDYPKFFEKVSKTLSKLLKVGSCTCYLIQHEDKVFWTRKYGSSETLYYPINKESILGYAYFQRKTVTFPNSDFKFDALYEKLENKKILCVPIKGLMKSNILGLLMISRKSEEFSELEIKVTKRFCKHIANCLESIKIHTVSKTKVNYDFSEVKFLSPYSQFKKINSLRTPKALENYCGIKPKKAYRETFSSKITKNLEYLFNIDSVPPLELSKLSFLKSTLEASSNPIKALAGILNRLIPSQAATLYVKDATEEHLLCINTEVLFKISGLVGKALAKNDSVVIHREAFRDPNFDSKIDSCGLTSLIESLVIVPFQYPSGVEGAMLFVNSPKSFTPNNLILAQYLSVIVKELTTDKLGVNPSQNESKRYKTLQLWCKQVFTVANSARAKQILSKSVLQQQYQETNINFMVQTALQLICELTNSEDARVLFKFKEEFIQYTTKDKQIAFLEDREIDLFEESLRKMTPVTLLKIWDFENMVVYPSKTEETSLIIQAWNKKDETLVFYSGYTKEDEAFIKQLARVMHPALDSSFHNSEEGLSAFRQGIRNFASNLNTHSFVKAIRSAAQKLLDSDRATVFMREGNSLVVKSQGIEHEIPVDYEVPVGKGIAGYVAQTGQTENIKDAYSDSRFNPEMDILTGYRTSTILCMPVLSMCGDVIAVLQMINKKNGYFDKADEETLEVFSEMVSVILQNWELFRVTIDEKTRLKNIMNSLGNYIMLLSSDGKLEYFNKPFEEILGVPEKVAKTYHYSSWLRHNRQMVVDITNVFQNTQKKISRNSQYILNVPLKTRSLRNVKGSLLESKKSVFNYTIAALHDYGSVEIEGVVIILEDASAIEELHSKFKAMQNEICTLTNPIKTETSLHKCINKLSVIMSSLKHDSETATQLKEVMKILKSGNLNRTTVKLPKEFKDLESDLTGRLKEYTEESYTTQTVISSSIKISSQKLTAVNPSVLRNWSLDLFGIEDHFPYVSSMLEDFGLLNEFSIQQEKLFHFYTAVKEGYELYQNPFHNFYHGVSVMHASYYLIACTNALEHFTSHEVLAILVASLCHDVGHTGRNNAFEINSRSPLAINYNDKSVLENYHSSLTFKILEKADCNIFEDLGSAMFKSIRKLILECILNTDMALHFKLISNMNQRLGDIEESPLGTRETDSESMSAFLVHCSDLAHPTKNFNLFSKWSNLVCIEFSNQYEEEVRRGLPPTEFMKGLDEPVAYYKNEIGFLTVVIKPLWECLNLWLSPTDDLLEQLNKNTQEYKDRLAAIQDG